MAANIKIREKMGALRASNHTELSSGKKGAPERNKPRCKGLRPDIVAIKYS